MAVIEKSLNLNSSMNRKFAVPRRLARTNVGHIALIYALAFVCWLGCQRFLTSEGRAGAASHSGKASEHIGSIPCSIQTLSCGAVDPSAH